MSYYSGGWGKYVSVAEKKRKAEKAVAALQKKGRVCLPVVIEKRTIARSFWGKKWCENLEHYSDYANRLPRGRTYVCNGSVVDLQIGSEKITALVAGSQVYEVIIAIKPLDKAIWQGILKDCAGQVGSLLDLLQGKLSTGVMEVVARQGTGLFPTPRQISFRCSCPDSASMCKHIAATLYGVGARLDSQPELLFLLRQVDPAQLIQQAVNLSVAKAAAPDAGHSQGLEGADLSALFGIDLGSDLAKPEAAPKVTAKAAPKALPKSPAKAAPKALPKVPAKKTLTAAELTARGVPAYMRQSWLKAGVLLATEQRGVYQSTPKTATTISAYLKQVAKRS